MQDDSLTLMLKQILNAQKKIVDNEMKDIDITMMQGLVLDYITRCAPGKVSPVDIERHFDLRHPTVSGMLKRLSQNGFVEFEEDESDHRKKLVKVTEKALLLRERVRNNQRGMEERVSAGFSEEELAVLRGMLKRILQNLTD